MVASTKVNRSHTPRKSTASSGFAKKPAAKPNTSILNFFQKTAKPEDSLFVGAVPAESAAKEDLYGRDDEVRYNEVEAPSKKRRISKDASTEPALKEETADASDKPSTSNTTPPIKAENENEPKKPKPRIKTPFVIDSDSEDEDGDGNSNSNSNSNSNTIPPDAPSHDAKDAEPSPPSAQKEPLRDTTQTEDTNEKRV